MLKKTSTCMDITTYTKNAAVRGTTQSAVSELSGGEFEDGFKTGEN